MGYVFFLFRRKERTKEKPIGLFSRETILVQTFYEAIYGKLHYFLTPLDSPRASGAFFYLSMWLTQAIILVVSGFREWTFPV